MQILLPVLIIIGLLIILFFLLRKPIKTYVVNITQKIMEESVKFVEQKNREVMKDERERINENVESKIKLGDQSLQSKKELIEKVVKDMREEVNQSQQRLIQSDKERIKEFQDLKTVIDQHKDITKSLQATTDNLRKILSNNQLRGNFGQEVAEDLLKMAGFVKGQNYTSQKQQESGSKPDFTVLLPEGTKINIDVKFPFQALQRWQETEDVEQQKKYLSDFKIDIKNKIKEVTTRDYINPEENTVDFVIMFIPNEMIFSFIYEKFDDVWREAMKNKVVMCGPFSFTAILRMVQQSYDNFKYQKDLHKIISHIKVFESEYIKFSDALDSLGQKITSVNKEYDAVSGVRDRQLTKIIDKIKSGETVLKSEKLLSIDTGDSE
ncbi:MAG: DNA recombination protein RmuC [bacterium]|nr:DNA recombination protein RmuC [bacterium]